MKLVELSKVHAGVKAGDLIGIAVEGKRGNGVGEAGGVDTALARLRPAGVVHRRIDVGIEAVFLGADLVPEGLRLLVRKVETDDRLATLEAVLPREDDADRSAVLVGQHVAVTAEGQQRKRVQG